jgi:hypothetical protein
MCELRDKNCIRRVGRVERRRWSECRKIVEQAARLVIACEFRVKTSFKVMEAAVVG